MQLFKIRPRSTSSQSQHFDDGRVRVVVPVLGSPRTLRQPDGIALVLDLSCQVGGHVPGLGIDIPARSAALDDHTIEHQHEFGDTGRGHQVVANAYLAGATSAGQQV